MSKSRQEISDHEKIPNLEKAPQKAGNLWKEKKNPVEIEIIKVI